MPATLMNIDLPSLPASRLVEMLIESHIELHDRYGLHPDSRRRYRQNQDAIKAELDARMPPREKDGA